MAEKILFSDLAERWLAQIEPTVSKNTYSIYKGYVKNYMLPYCEGDVDAVNRGVSEYIEKIERSEREELVKKFYPVFSMILEHAAEQGYIGFNYAKVNAPFSHDGVSSADVGIEALASILSQARHDGMLLDLVLILDLGLSRGEILGLKWGDVGAHALRINRMVVARGGVTHVVESENKRELALGDITARLLTERRENSGDDEFIFPSPTSATAPFNPSAYRKKIAKVTSLALGGDSITIELLGYALSILRDRALDRPAREELLALALERSRDYAAVEPKYRRAGTGYVAQISPNCFEGRYTPTIDGRRVSYNVYAKTKEECERKLAEVIAAVRR